MQTTEADEDEEMEVDEPNMDTQTMSSTAAVVVHAEDDDDNAFSSSFSSSSFTTRTPYLNGHAPPPLKQMQPDEKEEENNDPSLYLSGLWTPSNPNDWRDDLECGPTPVFVKEQRGHGHAFVLTTEQKMKQEEEEGKKHFPPPILGYEGESKRDNDDPRRETVGIFSHNIKPLPSLLHHHHEHDHTHTNTTPSPLPSPPLAPPELEWALTTSEPPPPLPILVPDTPWLERRGTLVKMLLVCLCLLGVLVSLMVYQYTNGLPLFPAWVGWGGVWVWVLVCFGVGVGVCVTVS